MRIERIPPFLEGRREPLAGSRVPSESQRFTIERGRWYAWTMYPGYSDTPYSSPIYVQEIELLGGRRYRLRFINAAYAEGVQGFEKVLQTTSRHEKFTVCDEVGNADRVVVIHDVAWTWLNTHFPDWIREHAPVQIVGTDLQALLTRSLMSTSADETDEPSQYELATLAPGRQGPRELTQLEQFLWDAMVTAIREGEVQAVERLDAVLAFAGYEIGAADADTVMVMRMGRQVIASIAISELEV